MENYCLDVDRVIVCYFCFFFQAEDGIRDLVRSRGLGDVYKRQRSKSPRKKNGRYGRKIEKAEAVSKALIAISCQLLRHSYIIYACLLYTSDAADERSSVDLGGRRIIKKKKKEDNR